MTTKSVGAIRMDKQTKFVLILVLLAMNVLLAVGGVAFILSQTDTVPVQVPVIVVPPSATPVPGQAIVIPTLPPVWTPTFTPPPTETGIAPSPTLEVSPTKVIKKTGPTATRKPSATAGPGVATATADACISFPGLCVTEEPIVEDTAIPQTTDCPKQWLADQYVPYLQNLRDWYKHQTSENIGPNGQTQTGYPMILPQDLPGWYDVFDRTRDNFANATHLDCVETQVQMFVTAQLTMRSALFDFSVRNAQDVPTAWRPQDPDGGSAKIESALAMFETAIQQVQSIAGQ